MRQYTRALCKIWSKWSFVDLEALYFVRTEAARYALTHMPVNETPRVYAAFLFT